MSIENLNQQRISTDQRLREVMERSKEAKSRPKENDKIVQSPC